MDSSSIASSIGVGGMYPDSPARLSGFAVSDPSIALFHVSISCEDASENGGKAAITGRAWTMLRPKFGKTYNNVASPARSSPSAELSIDERLEILRQLPEAYLNHGHRGGSMPTIAFMALVGKSSQDIREELPSSKCGFAKDELWQIVREEYGKPTNAESVEAVAHALAYQLQRFRPRIEAGGRVWKVLLHGPAKSHRMLEGPVDRYYLLIEAELTFQPLIEFPQLIGRCLSCGTTTDYDPNERFCSGNPDCFSNNFPLAERVNYVTILPERRTHNGSPLQRLELESSLVRFYLRDELVRPWSEDLDPLPYLPFEEDLLATEYDFSLGSARVYEVPQIAAWPRFQTLLTLDMSTYRPTGTLKDPKSLAVINCALKADVTHLVAYTAGNAGMSLAKLAYEVNQQRQKKLSVIALVGNDVAANVTSRLSACGCKVIPMPSASGAFPIVDTREMWAKVHAHIDHTNSEDPIASVWHVTDGCDGVGIGNYRAIFGRTLLRVPVDYLVVPAGTGNLLIGAALAIDDVAKIQPIPRTRLIAAVPQRHNIKQACIEQKMPYERRFHVVNEDDPVMPKLAGVFSPLIPCVSYLLHEGRVTFIEVSRKMHEGCASWIAGLDPPYRILAEPSALAGFAALVGDGTLPGLRELISAQETPSEYRSVPLGNARVMVVNTGFGTIGNNEYKFLADAGLR